MATPFVTLVVKREDVDRIVAELKTRSQDLSKVTGSIADEYVKQLRKNIDELTGPPLSDKYAAQKARKYPGKPLGRATDALYNSFHPFHGPLEAGAASTDVEYAGPEDRHYGLSHIPPELVDWTLQTLAKHLVGGLA